MPIKFSFFFSFVLMKHCNCLLTRNLRQTKRKKKPKEFIEYSDLTKCRFNNWNSIKIQLWLYTKCPHLPRGERGSIFIPFARTLLNFFPSFLLLLIFVSVSQIDNLNCERIILHDSFIGNRLNQSLFDFRWHT